MTTTPTPTIFTAAPDITYQWIDNDAALSELCQSLSTQSAIALDTEFVRTRTYYPHIGLLQIADKNGVYLIDPLAIDNAQPMADVLTNPAIVKVVHACSEDLEVCKISPRAPGKLELKRKSTVFVFQLSINPKWLTATQIKGIINKLQNVIFDSLLSFNIVSSINC